MRKGMAGASNTDRHGGVESLLDSRMVASRDYQTGLPSIEEGSESNDRPVSKSIEKGSS